MSCSWHAAARRYPHSLLTLRLSATGLVGAFSNAVALNERGFQQPLGVVRLYREAD